MPNDNSENTIATLKKGKASIKTKLTQFETYLKLATSYDSLSELHANELQVRLSRVENLIHEFDTLQTDLEALCESPDEQYADRDKTESQYYRLVAQARTLLDQCTNNGGGRQSQRAGSSSSSSGAKSGGTCCGHTNQFQLPKISIPKFDGNYQNWLEFRDTFISIIHENDNIDNISKFHYLRASLHGSAAVVVRNIDFTKENYITAWKLLCERYDNSRLLVNNHVQALFNVDPISKESSKSIRYLIDTTNKNVRALTILKQPTEHWDTLIIYMMSSKLDSVTNRYWEEYRNTLSEPPTLAQFCKFLRDRADLLESIEENRSTRSQRSDNFRSKSFYSNSSVSEHSTKQQKCPMCKSDHTLYNCDKFRDLSIESRITKAKDLRVCLNCLRPGHSHLKCQQPHCRYCKYKHNTLLHFNKHDETSVPPENVAFNTDSDQPPNDSDDLSDNVALSTETTQHATSAHILLSTALVKVYDKNGDKHTARLLLDNGSTANFMTQELCGKLGLSKHGTRSTVTSICNQSCKSTQSCNITIESFYGDYKVDINCLLLPQITKLLPSKLVRSDTIPIPSGIRLADPSFNVPAAVDILVGAEMFWNVLCNNSINLGNNQPKLYETRLGWLVSGYVARANSSKVQCNFIVQDQNISQFWELDAIPSKYSLTSEERACENKFKTDNFRNKEGRWVVTMPLKRDPCELGDSYVMAKTRFLSLERKFQRDPIFKEKYLNFMKEYEQLGHMTEDTALFSKRCSNAVNYYLPHHGVIRDSSTTTKLRTVFDASAVTTSGLSLNDLQMVGPTVQDDLLSILIRFRQHRLVISGDIEKMYRAIELNPSQRPLQKIIFRSDPSQPLKTYTLNTLTYGTAAAPYIATKCLTSLAEAAENPSVKFSISRDFYVDDYLSGGANENAIIEQTKGVISVLSSAGFNLRKFKSNCPKLLQEITSDKLETEHVLDLSETNSDTTSKTLGLNWISSSDTLSFSLSIKRSNKVTKRNILSVINKIFDPLGLVGPCVVEAKIALQKLWTLKLGWDDDVPMEIKDQWNNFVEKLSHLNDLKIPRWVLQNNYTAVELHAFSDASERAYGACIYARSISKNGTVYIQLVASKNKVAPIKPTTIPRLELCAALLSTRLCTKVQTSITLQVSCRYWCDSTIVLGWLSTPVNRLKPFVRNRVNEINDTTIGSPWSYVPSHDNPADLVSRGLTADFIKTSSLWWSGPQFLNGSEGTWPSMPNSSERRDLPEVLCHLTHNDTTTSSLHDKNVISLLTHKNSNLTRLIHIVAYTLRFILNCKNKQNKVIDHLTSNEYQNSLNVILRHGQSEMFRDEYFIMTLGKKLPPKNRLLSLSPFIDSDGLMRVGGRLDNSPYSYSQKHPVLLCSKHHLTKLIFLKQHSKLLHAGPQLLLADIRQTYWPLGGRNLARSIVKKCVKCFRQKRQNVQPVMGQLPESRTKLEFPFLNCAVDYAGPILIADRKGRGCKLLKSYLCIFICLAVKAVHLELVTDLSKEAYMAALHRFISRRGKPQTITSDNGTNFVGACNELQSLISRSNIGADLADEGIKFLFTPAYSPHFNGMAEAAVRSTKHHLRRILNLTHLTYEEMSTCLAQIEAILNSRPLTPLSTDTLDLSALTPSHFLIGRTLTSVPCPQITVTAINLLQRHKRVEAIKQHFWHRFSSEYIASLQQKTKWSRCKDTLKPDSLVLIKDKTTPPLLWSLGRVIQVYPGVDGINRVAEIKTKKGTIRRGWNNLCALPLDDNL